MSLDLAVSPYPNSALSAWQLAVMAVVIVASLSAWLISVYLAGREPRGEKLTAAGSAPGATAAGAGSGSPAVTAAKPEPERPSIGKHAA
jgi:hypothetical protein